MFIISVHKVNYAECVLIFARIMFFILKWAYKLAYLILFGLCQAVVGMFVCFGIISKLTAPSQQQLDEWREQEEFNALHDDGYKSSGFHH